MLCAGIQHGGTPLNAFIISFFIYFFNFFFFYLAPFLADCLESSRAEAPDVLSKPLSISRNMAVVDDGNVQQ